MGDKFTAREEVDQEIQIGLRRPAQQKPSPLLAQRQ